MPANAIWNTEAREAGCGGDQWASDFVDSFRFVEQLGTSAERNVQTVIVNALASSNWREDVLEGSLRKHKCD